MRERAGVRVSSRRGTHGDAGWRRPSTGWRNTAWRHSALSMPFCKLTTVQPGASRGASDGALDCVAVNLTLNSTLSASESADASVAA